MSPNPLNIPCVSVSAARAALAAQFADPPLRERATMLWGNRGVGKSSIVRQVAQQHAVPLVDLRLTTLEPVDLRGAVYADERLERTVWFPPEFLPGPETPQGLLFLDEITAADPRLQVSAYSLILDRRVGNYRLPEGWMVVAAGNAAWQGAVAHEMGTALADRMFHFEVQATIDAFLAHAAAEGFAPEVMAYLRVRPDRLDDSAAQLEGEHLVGASPRGWEDVSRVLQSGLDAATQRVFVQGRIGSANAAEFFGVLRELQAGADVVALLAAQPGAQTRSLLPGTLDGLHGLVYGLLAAAVDTPTLQRAIEVIEELSAWQPPRPLPLLEVQTLALELMAARALARGMELALLESPAYARLQAAKDPGR